MTGCLEGSNGQNVHKWTQSLPSFIASDFRVREVRNRRGGFMSQAVECAFR